MKWKPRDNGFSRPLNLLQMLAWAVYFTTWIYYFIFIIIVLLSQWAFLIVWGIIYFTFWILVFKYAMTVMLTNPIDQVIIEERKCKSLNISFNRNAHEFFWVIWDSHVSNQSKHWGRWNKCVSGFDHHWYWLNNWVGKK